MAIAAALVPLPPSGVERVYSEALYPPFQRYVTLASNFVPFALFDLAVLAGLVAFGLSLARDARLFEYRRVFTRCVGRSITVFAAGYLLFLATWGMNYRRVPLQDRLDFDRARISTASAVRLATAAVDHANHEYEVAHSTPFRPALLEASFAEAQRLLGRTSVATPGRPKRSLAGVYFRYAAIDGMTVPVFLEIILNPDVLPVERPSVLAHEWAHLAGYADESEANFVAWIAGVRSADPMARYSAWLDAYALAVGALPRDARAAIAPLDEAPRADLRNIAARYARSTPLVRTAARNVYDSYLKANRVDEGIASYGMVLQLLLGTRFDDGWTPRLAARRESD